MLIAVQVKIRVTLSKSPVGVNVFLLFMLVVVGPTLFCLLYPERSAETLLCFQIILIILFVMQLFLFLQHRKFDTRHSFIFEHITTAQSSLQTGREMLLITLKLSERLKRYLQRFTDFAMNT